MKGPLSLCLQALATLPTSVVGPHCVGTSPAFLDLILLFLPAAIVHGASPPRLPTPAWPEPRAQDTVAFGLSPLALPLVSWCLQIDEGNCFFVSDPLFQVELHQVQHLCGDREGLGVGFRRALGLSLTPGSVRAGRTARACPLSQAAHMQARYTVHVGGPGL